MCLDYIKLNCYFDGVLNQQEKTLVEEHLMSCAKCRLSLNNLNILNKTITGLNNPVVNESFINNLIIQLNKIHHPIYDELSEYCDNSLSAVEYNKINIHIEECEKCRDTVNQINVKSKNYFEQFDFKTSGNFLDGIFNKIDLMESINNIVHISNTEISAYIDNYLTDTEKEKVETHIKECAVCESKAKLFGLTRNTVLNLSKPVISLNFSKKVINEIAPEDNKVISISRFLRKVIPAASMVAGLLIVGTFFSLNNNIVDEQVATKPQSVNITVRSEDLLFSPQSQTYRTDSIDVLSDKSQDNSLMIEDIGL